jgi:hypothetical protein
MRYLLLIFFFYSINVHAQKEFLDGFIVTNSYDTIVGQIAKRGDILNGKDVIFKDSTQKERVLKPYQIWTYAFASGRYFHSKTILEEQADFFGELVLDDKHVFLEMLVDGIKDLYYFRDSKNDRYFVETELGQLIELKNDQIERYVDNRLLVGNSEEYKATINFLFNGIIGDERIGGLMLTHKDLIGVTSAFHSKVCDEKCLVYWNKEPVFSLNFGVFGSYGLTKNNISSPENALNNEFTNASFSNYYHPNVGLLLDIFLNRINRNLSLSIASNYSKIETTGLHKSLQSRNTEFEVQTTKHFTLNQEFIQSYLGFKYRINIKRARPFLNFGIAMNTVIKHEMESLTFVKRVDITEQSYLDLSDFLNQNYLGAYFQIGTEFNKKKHSYFVAFGADYLFQQLEFERNTLQSFAFTLGYFLKYD